MKPKLNKEDLAKQKKIREQLSNGEPLSNLSGRSGEKTGSDNDSEEKSTYHALMGDVRMVPPRESGSKGSDGDQKTIASSRAKQIISAMICDMFNPNKSSSRAVKLYTVYKGDTLESIAKRHGTTVDKLKKLNSFSDNDAANLTIGQKIRIR